MLFARCSLLIVENAMKKLRLELADLEVQVFPTTDAPNGGTGTVFARNTVGELTCDLNLWSCDVAVCGGWGTDLANTCDEYCDDMSNGCNGSETCGSGDTVGITFLASCC